MLLSFLFERCLGEVKSIHFTWYPTDRVTKYVTHSPSSKIHHQECNRSWPTWPTIILHFETHHIDFIIQISIYIYIVSEHGTRTHSRKYHTSSYIDIQQGQPRISVVGPIAPCRSGQTSGQLTSTRTLHSEPQRTAANHKSSVTSPNTVKQFAISTTFYNTFAPQRYNMLPTCSNMLRSGSTG